MPQDKPSATNTPNTPQDGPSKGGAGAPKDSGAAPPSGEHNTGHIASTAEVSGQPPQDQPDQPKAQEPPPDKTQNQNKQSPAPKHKPDQWWFTLPKFRLRLPKVELPPWRLDLVQFLLLIMATAYVVVSRQFVLLIYKKRFLAMTGITISLILPLANGCAEYSLMRWGYLISGVLVIGVIFIAQSPIDWILVALVSWLGLLSMVISGEILTSQKVRTWLIVMLQTVIALAATGVGWFLVWLMS